MGEALLKVKILRRDTPDGKPYWEYFNVPRKKNATVQDVLTHIQRNPVNADGRTVTPVVWECNCIEEVCGACAMVICGTPALACGTMLDGVAKKDGALVIEPLSKFPVVRDLVVDRTDIYENYKRYGLYASPKEDSENRDTQNGVTWNELYPFTRCLSCGICAEACPNAGTSFNGPVGYGLFNLLYRHGFKPNIGEYMKRGGVASCSGHSLCGAACPKGIGLPAAISLVNRAVNRQKWGG